MPSTFRILWFESLILTCWQSPEGPLPGRLKKIGRVSGTDADIIYVVRLLALNCTVKLCAALVILMTYDIINLLLPSRSVTHLSSVWFCTNFGYTVQTGAF